MSKFRADLIKKDEELIEGATFESAQNYLSDHFIERLKERYDITISENKYWELVDAPFEYVYEINSNKYVAKLIIEGQEVFVIKGRETKTLNTVIDMTKSLPIPTKLKLIEGYNSTSFDKDYDEIQNQMNEIVEWLKNNNYDNKTLFLTKPFNYDNTIYGAAMVAIRNFKENNNKNHIIGTIVKNIILKYRDNFKINL